MYWRVLLKESCRPSSDQIDSKITKPPQQLNTCTTHNPVDSQKNVVNMMFPETSLNRKQILQSKNLSGYPDICVCLESGNKLSCNDELNQSNDDNPETSAASAGEIWKIMKLKLFKNIQQNLLVYVCMYAVVNKTNIIINYVLHLLACCIMVHVNTAVSKQHTAIKEVPNQIPCFKKSLHHLSNPAKNLFAQIDTFYAKFPNTHYVSSLYALDLFCIYILR